MLSDFIVIAFFLILTPAAATLLYDFIYLSKLNKKLISLKQEIAEIEKERIEANEICAKRNHEVYQLEREKTALEKTITALSASTEDFKKITSSAKEEYFNLLEQEYQKEVDSLNSERETKEQKLLEETEQLKKQLSEQIESLKGEKNKLEEAVQARVEAAKREEKIQLEKENYMIPCSLEDKRDIEELEALKKRLSKPRILSMLIWQTYYQKPLKTLCNNLIGIKPKTGIYKITNQNNNMCYIGQAVDIATRFTEHVKCGCGVDTPVGNKLYAAMQKDGIYSFSFEVLEECPRDKLNEKEREYIALYQSKDFGYNTLSGVKK